MNGVSFPTKGVTLIRARTHNNKIGKRTRVTMAIRLFRLRQPKVQHQDPTRLASAGRTVNHVGVVRSAVSKEPAILDTVVEKSGSDPYNSSGQVVADKLRQKRYE